MEYWILSSKTLIHNSYGCIEDLVNIPDVDTSYFRYPADNKTLEPLPKWHQNLIRIFNAYVHFRPHDNDPTGDDWVKLNNNDSHAFFITGYDDFKILRMDGLVNSIKTSTTLSSKPYPKFKILRDLLNMTLTFSCLQKSGTMGKFKPQRYYKLLHPGCWVYFPLSLFSVNPWLNGPIKAETKIHVLSFWKNTPNQPKK